MQWQLDEIFAQVSVHCSVCLTKGLPPLKKMCYGKRVVCHKPGKELMYHLTEFAFNVTTVLVR
jgi:hypothetical protein